MSLFKSLEDERVKKLKTLKYGDSKPIVTKDIPLDTNFQEGANPLRNGLELQAGARVDDLLRITQLLASKPGLKFVANQGLLALSQAQDSVKTDGSNRTKAGSILNKIGKSAVTTAKVVGSTLAQVPVNGTGQHFVFGFNGKKGYLKKEGASIAKQGNSILPSNGKTGINSNFVTGTDKPKLKIESEYQYGADIQIPPTAQPSTHTISTKKYPTKDRKEVKFGLGEPGRPRAVIDASPTIVVDKVNVQPPGNATTRDFIKFNFQILTPPDPVADGKIPANSYGPNLNTDYGSLFGSTTPGGSGFTDPGSSKSGDIQQQLKNNPYIQFRAFLDSFDDSFNADWSSHKYIGRGENFYTYGGFSRSLNVSFKIAAQSEAEMRPLYQKIVLLASATAPTYSNNFMRGTIIRATIGDYLYRTPGVLNNVNYSWDPSYPWAIKHGEELQQELPMVLNCSLSFTPIHDFVPQTGLFNFITANDDYRAYFKDGKVVDKKFQYGDTQEGINNSILGQVDNDVALDDYLTGVESDFLANIPEPASVDEIVFDEFEDEEGLFG